MRILRFLAVVFGFFMYFTCIAQADDYVLTLKDHQFTPSTMTVPANQKIKIIVKNLDDKAAEFESSDFDRENVVEARGEITVFIGPLDAGSYGFFDDFHRETTGTLIAK